MSAAPEVHAHSVQLSHVIEACLMWVLVKESSYYEGSVLLLVGMFASDVFFERIVASLTDFECSVAERAGLIDGHRVGMYR